MGPYIILDNLAYIIFLIINIVSLFVPSPSLPQPSLLFSLSLSLSLYIYIYIYYHKSQYSKLAFVPTGLLISDIYVLTSDLMSFQYGHV